MSLLRLGLKVISFCCTAIFVLFSVFVCPLQEEKQIIKKRISIELAILTVIFIFVFNRKLSICIAGNGLRLCDVLVLLAQNCLNRKTLLNVLN
jgi:hypothetical protein